MTSDYYLGLAIGLLVGSLATSLYYLIVQVRRPRSEVQDTVEETIEPAESTAQDALVIDPENPPTWRFYSPAEGSPVRSCTCHGNPFLPGQAVMWWPVADSDGEVYLLCEDGVGIQAPVTQ